MLTKTTLKGTADDRLIKNLKRWSHALEFVDTFTKWDFSSRTFTIPLAKFVKQRMDNTVDERRQNAKEGASPKEKPHPVALSLFPSSSSSKDLRDMAGRKLERVNARNQSAKSRKVKTDKYVPPFFAGFCSSMLRPCDSDLSVECNDQCKGYY